MNQILKRLEKRFSELTFYVSRNFLVYNGFISFIHIFFFFYKSRLFIYIFQTKHSLAKMI